MNGLNGNRHYKYKNAQVTFFCPLCSCARSIGQNHKISKWHHVQIFIVTLFTTLALYPWCGLKSGFLYFFYWASLDFFRRSLFKKNLPCPHCGFDASWYKKDVKVARTKVKEFWTLQASEKAEKQSAANSAPQ